MRYRYLIWDKGRLVMKLTVHFLFLITAVLILWKPVFAEQSFSEFKKSLDQSFDETKSNEQNNWNEYAISIHKEWHELKRDVEKKWARFIYSSKKEWVDYDDTKDTRSLVNFEDGEIRLEAVVPANAELKDEIVARNLFRQLKTAFLKEDGKGSLLLQNQMVDRQGKIVKPETIDAYIEKEIIPRIQEEKTAYMSKDGVLRNQYSVSVKMVPNHVHIRARSYIDEVRRNAQRFSLDPRLIMAIIHTESYFNPMAVSGKGAIGLMQIVPKWAGKEAYEFLYGSGKIQPGYLYSPQVNIELGAAYLHLLQTRYFKGISDQEKIRQLSICAYNWGPTAINKKIVRRYDISKMSTNQLNQVLSRQTPKETREYLEKVTRRQQMYQAYF